MMDVSTFRGIYPEFSDSTAFPDGRVKYFLGLSKKRLNPQAWGEFLDEGIVLLTAHRLYVAGHGRALDGVSAATAGSVNSPVSSKSVGSVSKGMDTGATTVRDGSADAAWFNQSSYGIEFMQLSSRVGTQAMRQL